VGDVLADLLDASVDREIAEPAAGTEHFQRASFGKTVRCWRASGV